MTLPCLEMRGPQPTWSSLTLGFGKWWRAWVPGLALLFPRDCCAPYPELGAWQCAAESRACLHSRWDPALPVTHIPKQWRGSVRASLWSRKSPWWKIVGSVIPEEVRKSFLFSFSPLLYMWASAVHKLTLPLFFWDRKCWRVRMEKGGLDPAAPAVQRQGQYSLYCWPQCLHSDLSCHPWSAL